MSIDPNSPRWGFGGAFLVWLASILLQATISVLVLVPYSLKRGLNPGSPDYGRALVELASTDPTAVFLQVLSLLPSHLLTFAMVWALVTRFGRFPFLASIGWGWTRHLRVWQSVGLGIFLFVLGTALAKLLGAEKPTQLEQIINSSIAARYTIAFLAVFTAPFVEEFLYRGILYPALQRLIGVVGAVILVLGLFTLIHVPQYWPNVGVLAAVGLLSLCLTIIRAQTGRLLPCIVIHLVFNGIQAVLLIVEPYFSRPETDPAQVSFIYQILAHLGLT